MPGTHRCGPVDSRDLLFFRSISVLGSRTLQVGTANCTTEPWKHLRSQCKSAKFVLNEGRPACLNNSGCRVTEALALRSKLEFAIRSLPLPRGQRPSISHFSSVTLLQSVIEAFTVPGTDRRVCGAFVALQSMRLRKASSKSRYVFKRSLPLWNFRGSMTKVFCGHAKGSSARTISVQHGTCSASRFSAS